MVADESSKEILGTFEINKIASWGVSSEFFVINYADDFHEEKTYFKTTSGAAIEYLIRCYAHLLMHEPIP